MKSSGSPVATPLPAANETALGPSRASNPWDGFGIRIFLPLSHRPLLTNLLRNILRPLHRPTALTRLRAACLHKPSVGRRDIGHDDDSGLPPPSPSPHYPLARPPPLSSIPARVPGCGEGEDRGGRSTRDDVCEGLRCEPCTKHANNKNHANNKKITRTIKKSREQ